MFNNLRHWPWLAWVFYRLIYWKAWGKTPRHLDQNYGPQCNPKFVSALEAASKIKSGSILIVAALGGTGWANAIFRAIIELFKMTAQPSGLTIIATAGQGGRRLIPWSIDDLSKYVGLVFRFITGHLETFKWTLDAAEQGRIELHCIHQGALSQLIGLMAKGIYVFWTKAGLGTPYGEGSSITKSIQQFVETIGGQVRVTCPVPNVAIICATAADIYGKIYFDNVALMGEAIAAAKAVRKNGGIVIVQVGSIVAPGPGVDIADWIVVRRDTPQTLCFTQVRPFHALIAGAQYNVERALAMIRFFNHLAKLTPERRDEDRQVARAAATIVAANIKPGPKATLNVGVGLPEEVAAQLALAGAMRHLDVVVESGPAGGTPASGGFFGCEINPVRHRESWEVFADFEKNGIDIAVLGLLEADRYGNGNLSKRGPRIKDVVGPGGSSAIMNAARVIVFILRLKEAKTGTLKFVDEVREITFSAAEALKAGKQIYYTTDCGVFQLTSAGLKLIRLMPGYSLDQIRAEMPFIQVSDDVPLFAQSVVTGNDFRLKLAA